MNYEERQRRLDRARMAIHAEILIGLMALILMGPPALAAPGEASFLPAVFQLLILVAPVVSLLAWVWMLRLSRPQPEAGERSWRYHDGAA